MTIELKKYVIGLVNFDKLRLIDLKEKQKEYLSINEKNAETFAFWYKQIEKTDKQIEKCEKMKSKLLKL